LLLLCRPLPDLLPAGPSFCSPVVLCRLPLSWPPPTSQCPVRAGATRTQDGPHSTATCWLTHLHTLLLRVPCVLPAFLAPSTAPHLYTAYSALFPCRHHLSRYTARLPTFATAVISIPCGPYLLYPACRTFVRLACTYSLLSMNYPTSYLSHWNLDGCRSCPSLPSSPRSRLLDDVPTHAAYSL